MVSTGDNLYEKSKPAFWKEKKDIVSVSSAEFWAQRVVKINITLSYGEILFGTTWIHDPNIVC